MLIAGQSQEKELMLADRAKRVFSLRFLGKVVGNGGGEGTEGLALLQQEKNTLLE